MLTYEKTLLNLALDCANKGASMVQQTMNTEPLYLYYKPSTEAENGVLRLVFDSETAPDGFILATGEGLRSNVPYENYYQWVRSRISLLPILAWGKETQTV